MFLVVWFVISFVVFMLIDFVWCLFCWLILIMIGLVYSCFGVFNDLFAVSLLRCCFIRILFILLRVIQ